LTTFTLLLPMRIQCQMWR